MAFYEFLCQQCEVAFGVAIEKDIDMSTLFCVDCGANELELTAYDEEVSLRITSLVESVEDLTERIKAIEAELDTGPDDVSQTKDQDKTN